MKTLNKIIVPVILCMISCSIASSASAQTISNKISGFAAKINGEEVELNWSLINPSGLYKCKIESKRAGAEVYNPLTEILFSSFRKKEELDSAVVYSYEYSDKPQENGVYFYRVNVFDLGNVSVANEEIKIGITNVPEIKLRQNNPNPFNPSTVISYQVLVAAPVKLSVYSLTGKFVDVLVDAFQSPGIYNVDFNASNYSELSSGIYFYKLETNYSSDIRKMIFTK